MASTRRRRHDPLAAVGEGRVIPPEPSTIDLHTHTTRSDGVVAPATLIADAAAVGVTFMAITDHDTLAGYREVVAAGAVPPGMTLLPGVEINAIVTRDLGLMEGELHILGFGMDPDDQAFEAALVAQRAQRRRRFDRTVTLLRDLGLSIDVQVDALVADDDDALGRPTVARALIAAGHAATVEDAFKRYLAWGQPAYVPRTGMGPTEAIAAVRAAGGVPALAHFGEASHRIDIVRELQGDGLLGLEVYYRTFDAATVASVGGVAETLGLIKTGGSDYHGDLGTYAEAHAGLWVPPQVRPPLTRALAEAHAERGTVGT